MKMSRCRGCGRDIIWAFTERGQRMPLDPEPQTEAERGTQVLEHTEHETPHCRSAKPLLDPGPYYTPHWATCPNVDDFRRGKDGAS